MGRVVIDAPRAYDARTAEREALRDGVVLRLEHADGLRYGRDSHDATHLLRIGLSEPVRNESGTVVPVEVSLKPTGEGAEFATTATAPEGASFPATWLSAFDDAWTVLQTMRTLDVAKDKALLAALDHEDARLRGFAVQRLGERRSKVAVQPLCTLLPKETDGEVMYKIIGALVAIGDTHAVEPLIALSHQKDPAFVLQVVFAVGAIGGRTAKAYLVTLASGHPNEEVQRGAKDALDEMSRRAKVAQHEPAPAR